MLDRANGITCVLCHQRADEELLLNSAEFLTIPVLFESFQTVNGSVKLIYHK
jgi:hypothetical protein